MSEFEPVIGLEIHAELLTNSKMFCGCAVVDSTSAEPNTSVCEICTGMPGTLPVINERAIEYAMRVALALNCEVAETSVFARKNYFYPDLPKGYQISMYELPLARNGWLIIKLDGRERRIGIRRVHLEEDTGKLFHHDDHSLIDFNRSGVPLLEIVSEPNLNSLEDVKVYSHAIRRLLRYLEVTSGDMEKGVIRFEANISMRPQGSKSLGVRTEIKNLNSFRSMVRALAHEIDRQSQILSEGGTVVQETLGWDERRNVTVSQRGKEEAHDYRYFPEPDLPPLHIEPAWVARVKDTLPELPDTKYSRFMTQYDLTDYTSAIVTEEHTVADFFEEAVANAADIPSEKIANWLIGDFFALLNQSGIDIEQSKVTPQGLAKLVTLVEQGDINASSGKIVLSEMFASGADPQAIVEAGGYAQINDPDTISKFVDTVLEDNPQEVEEYLKGKKGISQWLFGQVMSAAGNRANPAVVRTSLGESLRSLEESRRAG
jgi:aspartyl-tRNA(Asn)/glutamyl-tRNA(Gln) amidotransferase subunit B